MKRYFLTIIIIAGLIVGCDEESNTPNYESDSIDLLFSTNVVDNVGLNSYTNTTGLKVAEPIPIFYIGRPSKECRWIGYCGRTFKWPWETTAPDVNTTCSDCRDVSITIAYDSTNLELQPIDLLLDGDISSASSDKKKFYVESEVRFAYDGDSFDSLIIPQQTLNLDTSLGSYGGYSMTVNGIINP